MKPAQTTAGEAEVPARGDGTELLRPLPLGEKTMGNRIVFGAHLTNFGHGQVFTPRHRAYYAARAAGGAGMIVTEALTVHPLDHPYEHVPFGHADAIIPSLRQLAGEVRAAAPGQPPLLLAQLNHTGGQSSGRILRQSPWAPSPVADVASKKMARAMEPAQIAEVVAGFAAAAARVSGAGLDGVEINAGQYALLRQFLSPLTNFRQDAYGGELENRARLLLEVVAAVREKLGPGALLGVKLCGDELAPWGGLTPGDAAAVALLLKKAGGVDCFSIQPGGPFSVHMTDPGMPIPEGYGTEPAAEVRRALGPDGPPVFAEGRLETPAGAARALAEGCADAVVMTRALVTDPGLPRKLGDQGTEPIRPHVGMMRYFTVRGDWNRPLGDLANPRAGREALLPPVVKSAGGPALVIGGGPAGLEAAITLARQGRPVRLLERGAELGGLALALAGAVPARAEFQRLVDYHRTLVARLGVEVETRRTVTGYEPWMAEFSTVLLAVGAHARPSPLEAAKKGRVFSAREVILGEPAPLPKPKPGALAVVVDLEYGFRMAAAVERLLDAGFAVAVVSDDFFVGRELVESAEMLWFNRVAERGATFHPRLRAKALQGEELVCADRFSGEEKRFGRVAAVVFAQRENPEQTLWHALRAHHPAVVPIGDARAPRLMGEAILNAHRAVVGATPGGGGA